jgi:hypothetical protein
LLPNPHLVEQPAGNASDAGKTDTSAGTSDAESGPVPPSEEPGTVRVIFEGAPQGARVTVGGNSVDGMTATVPRSSTAIAVAVSAAGFETFRESVVPSEDRVVRVRMRRTGTVATASRDAGSASTGAGTADAGRSEARTIGGRLGTTVVDDPENP